MPYEPHHIAMPFVLRTGSLGEADIIEARCLCGAGPWHFTRADLVARYGASEFCRGIFEPMPCRGCGARGGIMWQTMRRVGG